MRKDFDPKKYGDFTRGEVILVIQLSAAMQTVEEIIDRFHTFSGKKKGITGTQVIEIQADFSNFIAKKAEAYLKNIEGNPLSHPRIILDMCLDIYKECRKKVPSHTIKVADNCYETVEKEDLKTALAAVKLAKDYQIELKKIKMEEAKTKPAESIPNTAPSEWVLDDGMSND